MSLGDNWTFFGLLYFLLLLQQREFSDGGFVAQITALNGLCDPRASESGRSKRFLTALQSSGPEFKRVLAEPVVWDGAYGTSVMLSNEKDIFHNWT